MPKDSQSASYVCSKDLVKYCNRLPSNIGRSQLVHSLVESFGLFKELTIVGPKDITIKDLLEYHDESLFEQESEDCPSFSGLHEYRLLVGGGVLKACDQLIQGSTRSIFWDGGRHHCFSDRVSGFCYLNDVILGILRLQDRFHSVLYIDLDVHHGDAVQEAFYFSNRVHTFDMHRYEPGFFPGTGNVSDVGKGSGLGCTTNVVFERGVTGNEWISLFRSKIDQVYTNSQPECIVVQCGADVLEGDRLGECQVDIPSYLQVIQDILDSPVPVLLLGGGGYNHPNAARLWAAITHLCMKKPLSHDIPEHDYFTHYGPTYELLICGASQTPTTSAVKITHAP
ncbi:histone deacetylase 8 [Gorgonomyces haynaldii]|nr:histone deacetylase 8 [Gorgonomyces haynaldii]